MQFTEHCHEQQKGRIKAHIKNRKFNAVRYKQDLTKHFSDSASCNPKDKQRSHSLVTSRQAIRLDPKKEPKQRLELEAAIVRGGEQDKLSRLTTGLVSILKFQYL